MTYKDIWTFAAKEKGLMASRNFQIKLPPVMTLTETNLERFDDWMTKYEVEYVREAKRKLKEEAQQKQMAVLAQRGKERRELNFMSLKERRKAFLGDLESIDSDQKAPGPLDT